VIFLYSTTSRQALGSTQPPIQWVLGAFPPGVKWPGCEVDHSPASSAEVTYGGAIHPRLHGVAVLIKHRDSFTF
jgi:hypothetical protein